MIRSIVLSVPIKAHLLSTKRMAGELLSFPVGSRILNKWTHFTSSAPLTSYLKFLEL